MKKGFTIIETLVAITILMIAIAGPLVIASKGLTAAVYAKDQMIATFLAQESMEVIKNFRDNNYGSSNPTWLTVTLSNGDSVNLAECTQSKPCDASAFDTQEIYQVCPLQARSGQNSCKIYLGPSGYSHNINLTGASETIFNRYFYLEDVENSAAAEERVHVIVDWYEGTIPYQVHLTSELVNTQR